MLCCVLEMRLGGSDSIDHVLSFVLLYMAAKILGVGFSAMKSSDQTLQAQEVYMHLKRV